MEMLGYLASEEILITLMKQIYLSVLGLLLSSMLIHTHGVSYNLSHQGSRSANDSLPDVLVGQRGDLLEYRLRTEARLKFSLHRLPQDLLGWERTREDLRENIIQASGLKVDHSVPLDMKVTGTIKGEGYTIQNIYFQTLPGVYATANLFIPDGEGPFPAVVGMHGHWPEGKLAERVQAVGHTLAKNGYVCISMDAFGSGERATTHGEFEYHGANLGASLMNIGETLLGIQVADNMRAVDLLLSLPYVDPERIGATGASGGGNQTMWFAALDERVKAAMPVVSVGTFESAVMGSNCVCEMLPGGLTFTETSGVLALIAPRALKMCNHHQDSNPTFYPEEMIRSYNNALPIFKMHGAEDNIDYELFDLTHGYWPEDRQAMLGWFDLHLKGIGDGKPRDEVPFETLSMEKLMVFEKGKRDPKVLSIEAYAKIKGQQQKKANSEVEPKNPETLRGDLKTIMGLDQPLSIKQAHHFGEVDDWERLALETVDGRLIPLLHHAPQKPLKGYTMIAHSGGKHTIPHSLLQELKNDGRGLVIMELSGTGELASVTDKSRTSLPPFHTLARAHLWLGQTLLGQWAEEIHAVSTFVKNTYAPDDLAIDADKEAGLAALLGAVAEKTPIDQLVLRNVPASYLFDSREHIDYFSMGVHLPGFVNWGDVMQAAAMAGKNIAWFNPVSIAGQPLSNEKLAHYKEEYDRLKKSSATKGDLNFRIIE
jgi:hypothetical protein